MLPTSPLPVKRTPITAASSHRAGLAFFSRTAAGAHPERVYVALSTEGVAVFDVSGYPEQPLFNPAADYRRFNPDPFPHNGSVDTFYQCIAGPGDSLLVSGLYSGVFHIADYHNIVASDVRIYRTRYQPIGMATDPSDPTRSSFFVADGRGGALRIQLPTTP